MSTVKVFKRGEILYKEGEKPAALYLIQSGAVNLFLTRQKQPRELCTLGSGQIVGEHALTGAAAHPHSAVANVETKAIELSIDFVKMQMETGTQLQKFLNKGLCDKLKVTMKEITSMKLERDNTPCPEEQTAKIFATLFHCLKTKGEFGKDGSVRASWPAVKQYAQRLFMEPPRRLEMAANIFVKLGWAKYDLTKVEETTDGATDGPEAITSITIADCSLIEQFFEFFQYYYFKGAKQDMLKVEDREMTMVQSILELAVGVQADHNHVVTIPYSKVIDKIKELTGLQLNNDHWALLEKKGLYVKRESLESGVSLQFDFPEFERTGKFWKILREIERWNEKGSVDPNEPVEVFKKLTKTATGPSCQNCGAAYEGLPKFCAECGNKIVAAA